MLHRHFVRPVDNKEIQPIPHAASGRIPHRSQFSRTAFPYCSILDILLWHPFLPLTTPDHMSLKPFDLLNNPQSDSYFVYFYEVGNKKCEKANEDLKKEMTIISNVYYFNIEDTTLKRGKDFDYKNVTDYEDITIKQVPMMIHVEDKKIDHVYYKASDIKKALE